MLKGDRLKKCLLTTNFSPKMRTLVYIMIFNLYPVRNLMNLSHPRALFLHDLFQKKDINICANIYHLLKKCVSKRTSQMTLPFLGLIMSIMQHERVRIPPSLLVMKREDQISAQTMMRSKTCLCGLGEEEERAECKALLLRVVTPTKILITSPSILKTWKPHLFSHNSNHKLSLRDSHMHLLMLPIASTCFLTNLTISSVQGMLCNGRWMIIMHTPPHRWYIFKSKSLLSLHSD